MITRRRTLAAIAAFLLAALPAFAQQAGPEPAAGGAEEMPVQRRYMMEDLYGNVMTNEDFLGRFVLVYFGYTGCPDVCPTSLSTMADALDLLGEDAARVAPVFVTVDPDRDTAKLLQEYLGFFDERLIGLRGPLAYTDNMVKAFNARYEKNVPDPAKPEHYSIDHTASIAFLDPNGFLIKRFPHGTAAEAMADEMRAIIAETPTQ